MIEAIEVEGYRSIRCVRMSMRPVLVVVGENGTGKTTLYRALQLFQGAASGNLARAIAEDGRMESVLWAASAPTMGSPAGVAWLGPARLQFEADPLQMNSNAGAPPGIAHAIVW